MTEWRILRTQSRGRKFALGLQKNVVFAIRPSCQSPTFRGSHALNIGPNLAENPDFFLAHLCGQGEVNSRPRGRLATPLIKNQDPSYFQLPSDNGRYLGIFIKIRSLLFCRGHCWVESFNSPNCGYSKKILGTMDCNVHT